MLVSQCLVKRFAMLEQFGEHPFNETVGFNFLSRFEFFPGEIFGKFLIQKAVIEILRLWIVYCAPNQFLFHLRICLQIQDQRMFREGIDRRAGR